MSTYQPRHAQREPNPFVFLLQSGAVTFLCTVCLCLLALAVQ